MGKHTTGFIYNGKLYGRTGESYFDTGVTTEDYDEMEKKVKLIKDIRPEVLKFAIAMEEKLKKNDHKGGWKKMSYEDLWLKIQEECAELYGADTDEWKKDEAVDIANFAMMIFDNINNRC